MGMKEDNFYRQGKILAGRLLNNYPLRHISGENLGMYKFLVDFNNKQRYVPVPVTCQTEVMKFSLGDTPSVIIIRNSTHPLYFTRNLNIGRVLNIKTMSMRKIILGKTRTTYTIMVGTKLLVNIEGTMIFYLDKHKLFAERRKPILQPIEVLAGLSGFRYDLLVLNSLNFCSKSFNPMTIPFQQLLLSIRARITANPSK